MFRFPQKQVIIAICSTLVLLPVLGYLLNEHTSYDVMSLSRSQPLSVQELYDILAAKHP